MGGTIGKSLIAPNVLLDPLGSLVRLAVKALMGKLKKPPLVPVDTMPPESINDPKPPQDDDESERKRRKRMEKKMIEDARNKLGIDCVNHYNFAVSGASGTGKSSFINAIRMIPDNHKEAAKVGVTETTHDVKCYNSTHPDLKHAFVWDLPGAGTQQHLAQTYFMDMKLYAFDSIFILSSDRFLQVDIQVTKSALEYRKPIAFVRTKADEAIKSLSQIHGLTAEQASKRFRSEVSDSFKKNLQLAGLESQADKIPLFIISNKAFTRPNSYSFYDSETENVDRSLKKMDEDKIFNFMEASIQTRFRPCPCRCSHP